MKKSDFLSSFSIAHPEVTPNPIYCLESITQLPALLSRFPFETLIAIDVDQTIFQPDSKIFRYGNQPEKELMFSQLKCHPRSAELRQYINAGRQECLVEESTASTITDIQLMFNHVIGFTARRTGYIGSTQFTNQVLTEEKLNKLGVSFDLSFSRSMKNIDIGIEHFEHRDTFPYEPPLVHKGTIYSSWMPKGEVLVAFCKAAGWQPTHLVMVDDKLSELQSLQEACEKLGIGFQGFHYVAAKNTCVLNTQLVDHQLQFLVEQQRWLPESEITTIIETEQTQQGVTDSDPDDLEPVAKRPRRG